jgi:hypothetical protein
VQKVAQLFLEKRISGAPVVDEEGKLLGMVSEGDLLHRSEAGTGRRRSWWLGLLAGNERLASEYAREHGRHVADICPGASSPLHPTLRCGKSPGCWRSTASSACRSSRMGKLSGW